MRNDFYKDKAKEFWNKLEFLKIKKASNTTWKQICSDLNLNLSTFHSAKNYGSLPNSNYLNALASYFGVSVDYLLGDEQKPTKEEKNMLMRRTNVAKKIFELRPQAFFMIERMLGDEDTKEEELDIYEE